MEPELTTFLQHLFTTGEVSINTTLPTFSPDDKQSALQVLNEAWQKHILQLPHSAPAFNPNAALWAAELLYKLLQFALVRNLEASEMETHLSDYPQQKDASAMLSADICLRHLPILFGYIKALSPNDPLVTKTTEIAMQWPYSSVGTNIGNPQNEEVIIAQPALFQDYIDKIIQLKDKTRISNPLVRQGIESALGKHGSTLWPEYKLLINTHTPIKNETEQHTIN